MTREEEISIFETEELARYPHRGSIADRLAMARRIRFFKELDTKYGKKDNKDVK